MNALKAAYLDWMRARIAMWESMIEVTNLSIRRMQGGVVTSDQEMSFTARCDTASRFEQMARNAYSQRQDEWTMAGRFQDGNAVKIQ